MKNKRSGGESAATGRILIIDPDLAQQVKQNAVGLIGQLIHDLATADHSSELVATEDKILNAECRGQVEVAAPFF